MSLRAYEYEIIYKPGRHHENADAHSRLLLPETEDRGNRGERAHCGEWPQEMEGIEFRPYKIRKQELSVQIGCVL